MAFTVASAKYSTSSRLNRHRNGTEFGDNKMNGANKCYGKRVSLRDGTARGIAASQKHDLECRSDQRGRGRALIAHAWRSSRSAQRGRAAVIPPH
jgi:hypothetical protein